MSALQVVWRQMKFSRSFNFGPVALLFRFVRRVPVSSNRRRRWWAMLSRQGVEPTGPADVDVCTSPALAIVSANTAPAVGVSDARVETALIVGVGPGLGHALARSLAAAGMQVALASRNAERLDPLVEQIRAASGQRIRAYGCDATDERSVQSLMALVSRDLGVPDLVVYSLQSFGPGRAIEVEVPAFEESWRQNCLGGFIVARQAARCMLPQQRGTIVLVGSTSGLQGRADHLNLAVGKFGLRAISQVMARELWPEGIHVVHCVIDADIQEDAVARDDPQARPEDIAELIATLHRQPRSCWSSEIDVRPWNERFWEHC